LASPKRADVGTTPNSRRYPDWITQRRVHPARTQWPTVTFFCCISAAMATAALIHISDHDRRVRDKHREDLKDLGLKFGIDFSDPAQEKYQDSALNLRFIGSKFYLRTVLCFLGAFDLTAAVIFLRISN
jgi:hypothetical protein